MLALHDDVPAGRLHAKQLARILHDILFNKSKQSLELNISKQTDTDFVRFAVNVITTMLAHVRRLLNKKTLARSLRMLAGDEGAIRNLTELKELAESYKGSDVCSSSSICSGENWKSPPAKHRRTAEVLLDKDGWPLSLATPEKKKLILFPTLITMEMMTCCC